MFTHVSVTDTVPIPAIWLSDLKQQEDSLRFYPTNGFEDMIRMTEREQLWQYPIDNEQG